MKRILLFTVLCASAMAGASGAVIEATPGSLEHNSAIFESTDDNLEVTGRIDVRDLRALASVTTIKSLDLSGAKIVSYTAATPDTHGQSYFSEGRIPQYVFFKSPLTSIILPSGVTEIADGAFANSDLKTITLPEGLRVINDHAFYGCSNLAWVALPSSVVMLGPYAFANCTSLKTADLRNTSVTVLPNNLFSGCTNLTGISFPVGLRTVGSHALEGTAMTTLTLGQITRFEDYALAGMPALTEVTFGTNVSIGVGVLMDDTKLQTINKAPASLPVLFAANCTSLDTSAIASKTIKFDDYSLANTIAENLVLSPRLTYVGAGALKNMKTLALIDARSLGEQIPDADPTAFAGIDPTAVHLYVEDNTEDLWKAHPVWKNFIVFSDATDVRVVPVYAPKSSISYNNGLLSVLSSEEIRMVDVYNIEGALLHHAEPNVTNYETSLDTTSNVIIVRIVTPSGVESSKILVY